MIDFFVPVYNEEQVLLENILSLYRYLKFKHYKFKLIIFDDGSTDTTPAIGKQLAWRYKQIEYIHYDKGPSRREGLAKHLLDFNGDTIVYLDADLSTPICYIPKLLHTIEKHDIAIGSKYKPGAIVIRSWFRRFVSVWVNGFVMYLFKSKVNDHCCGFKAFKREALEVLLPEMGENNERSMAWDIELLVRAQIKGLNIKEFPISWRESKKSALSVLKDWALLLYLLKLRWRIGTIPL